MDTQPKYLPADDSDPSGNVREKLEWASAAPSSTLNDYSVNVQALEAVQPKDLSASEFSSGSVRQWIPPEIIEQFIFELFDTPAIANGISMSTTPSTRAKWSLEGNPMTAATSIPTALTALTASRL
jgi:N12 class adenine-specific DNA methylase